MCTYLSLPKKSEFYLEKFGGKSLYVYTLKKKKLKYKINFKK